MASQDARTSEAAMRIAALQIAADSPNGEVTTTELKEKMHLYVNLTDDDCEPNPRRGGEPMYYQIVGNIVSHHDSTKSLFSQGYAVYTGDGIQITDEGRAYLTAAKD